MVATTTVSAAVARSNSRQLTKIDSSMKTAPQHQNRNADVESFLGLLCLLAGAVLLAVIAADRWMQFRLRLPELYYRSRNLHLLISLGLFALGTWFHRRAAATRRRRLPLFREVVVYSRPDCCLCDEALLVLQEFSEELPAARVVDISGDEQLEAEHGESIPVIEMDGRIRFRGIVNRALLRRLIDAESRNREVTLQNESTSA